MIKRLILILFCLSLLSGICYALIGIEFPNSPGIKLGYREITIVHDPKYVPAFFIYDDSGGIIYDDSAGIIYEDL